ncbi:MAG TPA: 2-amino-4-hydroxy-6-hydroxymethyldihydropteridine diphosphokinase [Acidimicrobiales bacterium]|nr:2-amino-4-hydroxy-6-hydroxymethyldihydropteridine diphosphokinase [Acidimicrobiales bacterium]
MRFAYLSLGSNVGDRKAHFEAAIPLIAGGDPYRLSHVYETEPVGGVPQDDFWNMVIELETNASPRALIGRARAAEESRQRARDTRWGPRTLDVDVLIVGNEVSDDPEVIVPHPRLYERAFVLVPLRELAPGLVSEAQIAASAGRIRELGTLESLR